VRSLSRLVDYDPGLSSTVKSNLEDALRRILTPKTSTDLLHDISAAKAQGRPYTITFVGVNGVGKSTNLSKICFWLLQNRLKVLIAAGDTFRSGAVEQLRVHVRNLNSLMQSGTQVDLFERGYGKDAANIAKDAIHHGSQHTYHCSRQQNKISMMWC
jgi:signal recognition particle receptor subunit alpha